MDGLRSSQPVRRGELRQLERLLSEGRDGSSHRLGDGLSRSRRGTAMCLSNEPYQLYSETAETSGRVPPGCIAVFRSTTVMRGANISLLSWRNVLGRRSRLCSLGALPSAAGAINLLTLVQPTLLLWRAARFLRARADGCGPQTSAVCRVHVVREGQLHAVCCFLELLHKGIFHTHGSDWR